jgi:hypothetical protein
MLTTVYYWTYHNPVECSPYLHNLFNIHFNIILPRTPVTLNCLFPSGYVTKIMYAFLSPPISPVCIACLIFLNMINHLPYYIIFSSSCNQKFNTNVEFYICVDSSYGIPFLCNHNFWPFYVTGGVSVYEYL